MSRLHAFLLVAGLIVFIFSPTIVVAASHDPILIVPGSLATEMYQGTRKIWPDVARMLLGRSNFLNALGFTANIQPKDSTVTPGQVITSQWGFDYVAGLINGLRTQGYSLGVDLFLFPYDWRKSVSDIADTNLRLMIHHVLDQTEATKLILIGHSQGGLIIKKLLFDQPNLWRTIAKVIFVATPNLGAPKAAKVLLYGDNLGLAIGNVGLQPQEIKVVSHNLPAAYQLLPSASYFTYSPGYSTIAGKVLNYEATEDFLKAQHLNSQLVDEAAALHVAAFDTFNISSTGIPAFNIVGCGVDTLTNIVQGRRGYSLAYSKAGDGTVPLISAASIVGAQTWFVPSVRHDAMLSANDSRQEIINLATGNNSAASNVSRDPQTCAYYADHSVLKFLATMTQSLFTK